MQRHSVSLNVTKSAYIYNTLYLIAQKCALRVVCVCVYLCSVQNVYTVCVCLNVSVDMYVCVTRPVGRPCVDSEDSSGFLQPDAHSALSVVKNQQDCIKENIFL